jgi:hypothetical protein
MQKRYFQTAFWAIIVVATFLRFYNFVEIPYTHDEFSALHRTQFDSFNELIENGVKVDGHPAGVQVFIYYYINVFGSEPWAVRFPFAILGILSVALIMLIGKRLYSPQAGLFAGAVAAVSQYFIFYSIIARPYSPGLFFVLFSIYALLRILERKKFSLLWYGTYAVSLALSAYVHHFSAFTALFVFINGFFLLEKEYRIKYFHAGLLALLLYLPHLNILIAQFSMKGVGGWLPVPEWSFIYHHVGYLFHFSSIFIVILAFMVISTVVFLVRQKFAYKSVFLLLLWLVVYFTAFFYSRNVSAVMQNSVLLFAVAGLLIFLSSGITAITNKVLQTTILAFTILVGVYTLVVSRQHFPVISKGLFQESVNCLCEQKSANNADTILFVSNHSRIPHMLKADTCASKIVSFGPGELKNLKENLVSGEFTSVGIMINGTLPGTLAMIKNHYPNHILANKYDRGEFHFFSKSGKNVQKEWDTIVMKQYDYSGNAEFLGIAKLRLDTLKMNSWSEMDIVFHFWPDSISDEILIVTDLFIGDNRIDWRGTKAASCGYNTDGSRTIYHSIPFMDIHYNIKEMTFNTYIYNPKRYNFKAIKGMVMIREANRMRYSLYDRIPNE